MLDAKNASSLSHANDVKDQLWSLWATTPKIKNSLLTHLVMVGYISLSRSASPKFSYTCHGLVIANPAQAGPPAPETVGAVLATRPSGPWTSAKSRAHLVKNAPAHTGGFNSAWNLNGSSKRSVFTTDRWDAPTGKVAMPNW